MTEEWKWARQWIISTGVDAMIGRSMQYSEKLFEFAESLRDGVVLCEIANTMEPLCIQNVRKVQNIQLHEFLCKCNIRLFLTACEVVFRIDKKDLFSPCDLYLVTDFKAVVRTISVLSNHTAAACLQSSIAFGEVHKNKLQGPDDDLYSTLPGVIEQKDDYAPYYVNVEENIYDKVEKNYGSNTYNALLGITLERTRERMTKKGLRKRDHIINEILETEEGYIENLKTMVEGYIVLLKQHIRADDKEVIFMNTEKLYALHLNFYRELANVGIVQTNDSAQREFDATAFVRYKTEFVIYSYYCSLLERARKRIAVLLKRTDFCNIIEEVNTKLDRRFPLHEQLAVPFQRILRYPLLLGELLKNTPDYHAEYQKVKDAFDTMEDVAKYINAYMNDTEIAKDVSLVFELPIFNISKDYPGKYLEDGDVQVQFENTNKKEKRCGFLFQHALLLCRSKGDSYEVKENLDLSKFIIEESPAFSRGKFTYSLSLKARHPDGVCEEKNCIVFVKTEQLKNHWFSAITDCIRILTLSDYEGLLDQHQFTLQTFSVDNAVDCAICKKLLKGQVSQGYTCQCIGCGINAHYDCLGNCPKCDGRAMGLTRKPKIKRSRTLGFGSAAQTVSRTKVQKSRSLGDFCDTQTGMANESSIDD